jgi:hypothetical protein
MLKTLSNTQQLVAKRIFDYYLQIIEIKKQQNVTNFFIDVVPDDTRVSLVYLEDKYDGKSFWRQCLGINDEDNWKTLLGSFKEAFENTSDYYVDIDSIFEEISIMLSKQGVANYFDILKDSEDGRNYAYTGQKILVIVL